MTETSTEPPRPGVDRDGLRNYEHLRRSRVDRKIAGVAGGLGRHLNIDPTVLRVLFVVLSLFGGAGLFLYAVAWVLVPEEGHEDATVRVAPGTRNLLLIGAGVLALLGVVGNGWNQFWVPWPLLVVGAVLLVWLVAKDQNAPRSVTPSAPTGPGEPLAGGAADVGTAGYVPAGPPPWAPAPSPPSAAAPPPPPRRPRKTGPRLFGPTLALIAIALGSLGIVDAAGVDVADAAYAALALTVTGAMLVLGAFVGRPGGLTLVGIVAAVALAGTSWGPGFDGEGRQVTDTPSRAAQVDPSYRVEAGQIRLDLSRVADPEELAGRTVQLRANAGEIQVVLPDDVEVDVEARIDGPGAIDLPDESTGGIGRRASDTFNDGATAEPLTIQARTDIGHIEFVER